MPTTDLKELVENEKGGPRADSTGFKPSDPAAMVAFFPLWEESYRTNFYWLVERVRSKGFCNPEDIVQEVYLEYWYLRSVPTDLRLIYHRCFSRACSAYRSKKHAAERDDCFSRDLGDVTRDVDEELAALEKTRLVELVLMKLTPRQRWALDTHYLRGVSVKEMMELSGESEAAIKGLLFRARLDAACVVRRVRKSF